MPLAYDELGLFHENAEEAGLPWSGPPEVERVSFEAPSGHRLSGLRWGSGSPELVLLHGGAQNAHTWDTVALALERPLLAIDLPGHGHSDWRHDRSYRPQAMADDVGAMIEALVGEVELLAGMSLGGLTATVVAAERPRMASRVALVDITPGVDREKAKAVIDFISGPESFASFEELLERTMLFNPTRSESSLRRGILHNARERPDGSWVWRYDLPLPEGLDELEHQVPDLWDAIDAIEVPLALFQGGRSPVVGEEDVTELRRRHPGLHHVVVEDAGHSIQGDQPLRLAELFDELLRES